MTDFVSFVEAESQLFNQSLRHIWDGAADPASVAVPPCPDWSAADLAWHLTEVQYFWASIVEGRLLDPSAVKPLSRPTDDGLLALNVEQAERLTDLLANGDPAEPCWSWHEGRQDIAWVRRRQAHEVLVHRVDAEMTAASVDGAGHTPVDEELAADGIDEILSVMLSVGDIPEWGSFEEDGSSVRLEVPGRSWHLALGHLNGTDQDGTDHHLPAIKLVDQLDNPSAVLSGPASNLDLWLWRRAELVDATVSGDAKVIEQLHELAAIA